MLAGQRDPRGGPGGHLEDRRRVAGRPGQPQTSAAAAEQRVRLLRHGREQRRRRGAQGVRRSGGHTPADYTQAVDELSVCQCEGQVPAYFGGCSGQCCSFCVYLLIRKHKLSKS